MHGSAAIILDSARFFVLGVSAVRYAGLSSSECSPWAPPSLIHCAYLQRCLLLHVDICINWCCVALQVVAESMASQLCNQLVLGSHSYLPLL